MKVKNLLIVAIFLSINVLWAYPGGPAEPRKPNVVLIMADDLGYECIGVNGGESYLTPEIDKLAKSGMRFAACHSQPLCTPSRVQIMTGIYNNRNYIKFGMLERSQTTFAHLFKKAGYSTVIAGKWQLGREEDSPNHFGFDEYCLWQNKHGRTDAEKRDTRFSNPRLEINGHTVRYTDGEYGPDIVSDFICDFMEQNRVRPFLVYYPMILTHCPFTPTPESKDWDPGYMGSQDYTGDTAYFGDMVSYMDKMVGKIVSKLDELGLRDNTLVLFTGDNGTDQPVYSVYNGKLYQGGKGLTTDNGTHVPLVANWPGVIGVGECNDLIDFSDILPTICEAAGIDVPGELKIDGRSFLDQLRGERGSPREWIYAWYSRDGKTELKEWARDHSYKLYKTGEFFNLEADFLEENPLNTQQLTSKEKKALRNLQKALL